jgi:hypothetical protein
MTKKKPGARMGRPPGTGKGLTEKLFLNATKKLRRRLEAEAKARDLDLSVLMREVLERWLDGTLSVWPEPAPAPPPKPKKTAKKTTD